MAEASSPDRDGHRHRFQRVTDLPGGASLPERVRLYWRSGRYWLQWWDTKEKHGRWQRIEGDLIEAIMEARQIDQRLATAQTAGQGRPRLGHAELVKLFLEDLTRRSDAGEVCSRTVQRYRSALQHYLDYVANAPASFRRAASIDRRFALEFGAYLDGLMVSPNGHPNTPKRRLRSPHFVLDTVRAMFEWAADPGRAHLLPHTFRNPFLRHHPRPRSTPDMLAEPDITVAMAAEFLGACDEYQLRLFAPIALYGLRASEPAFLFNEFIEPGWLNVRCIGELDYQTKGRRDKRLPLIGPMADLLRASHTNEHGLMYYRRAVAEGCERPALYGAALTELSAEYERRLAESGRARLIVREQIRKEAGALTYDHIESEFHRVARRLQWPSAATLKDFRHLFCTAMANAGMPEHERRYLMGHAPGKAAIMRYTHLDKLAKHYREAVTKELAPLLQVLQAHCATHD